MLLPSGAKALQKALQTEIFDFGNELGTGKHFVAAHEVSQESFLAGEGREGDLVPLQRPQCNMKVIAQIPQEVGKGRFLNVQGGFLEGDVMEALTSCQERLGEVCRYLVEARKRTQGAEFGIIRRKKVYLLYAKGGIGPEASL